MIKYNSKRNKVLVFFLKFISFFGKDPFWDLLIAFYLLIWYNPVLFSYIGVTFLNGVLVNLLVKKFTNRDRPYLQLESVKTLERPPSSKSFPSWHAYTSAAETLVISYIFHNPILSIVLFVLSILICFSRIQLGVHYPSDVIIGYVIGLLGGIITIVILGPLILNLIQYFESLIPHLIYHDRINPLLSEPWYALVCVGIFVGLIFYTIYRTIGKQKLKEILLR
ncbi:MAG: phosphatase PAP2 family protein [Candidatus Lokiarchaeota archaeon]|nr:phosphatase PAP2 family protein [Candidatus Lokiarchaeota archaeon]